MNIAAGTDQPSVLQLIELVRENAIRNIDVVIYDENGDPKDIVEEVFASGTAKGALDLEITDISGNVVLSETYWPTTSPTTRRIEKLGTGRYALSFGSVSGETDSTGTYLANWHARIDENSEDMYRTQVIEVVSPKVLSLLPSFRLMLDKSLKMVDTSQLCMLGYTDGMMIAYLKQGLQMINAYEPYPLWNSLETFPIQQFADILIKAGTYTGLIGQSAFAIDTDVPSYADQGHSFVITHYQPLMQMLNVLKMELDQRVPNFKRRFLAAGSISVELRIDAAYSALLSSAPYGTLFRNMYLGG